LPWRRTRDPWSVLVAEVMLSQTTRARVMAHYPGFLAKFTTPAQMVQAGPAEVIAAWVGLGYNRRARHLYDAAVIITREFSGETPVRRVELLKLPGVGPTISAAVAAQAGGARIGYVDTNVSRLLSRYFGLTAANRATLESHATRLVQSEDPWTFTQAILDFGAKICSSRPHCDICEVRTSCSFGGVGEDPAQTSFARTKPQTRFEGSHRQRRATLVRHLSRSHAAPVEELAAMLAIRPHECIQILEELQGDGLVMRMGDLVTLARAT